MRRLLRLVSLHDPSLVELRVFDRLKIMAVRHVNRAVLPLYNGRIVETLALGRFEMPRPRPRCPAIFRERYSEAVALFLLVVVYQQ